MEREGIILKYSAVVNQEKVAEQKDLVRAVIEIQVTPEREHGFDALAKRIYMFPQVKSLYLMSGGYDLQVIIERSANILNINIDSSASLDIARRSRGTPRIANRLLNRVRDYAEVLGSGEITKEIADQARAKREIDEVGLDFIDRKIVDSSRDTFGGGPVGLDTLSATIGEDSGTIEDVYEPYLLQLGFIARTPRGRVVLENAYKHLGLEVPSQNKKN